MGSYKIILKKSVEKDLRSIDSRYIPKIMSAIQSLVENPTPHGFRQLVGTEKTYRIRIGDYRVIYLIDSLASEILIQHIAHRKDVYR